MNDPKIARTIGDDRSRRFAITGTLVALASSLALLAGWQRDDLPAAPPPASATAAVPAVAVSAALEPAPPLPPRDFVPTPF